MFDWCTTEKTLVRSVSSESSPLRSSRPSSPSGIHRSVAPVLSALLPGHQVGVVLHLGDQDLVVGADHEGGSTACPNRCRSVALLNAYAARLMDSVAFFVNTSSGGIAPTKPAMVARADS